MRYDTTAGGRAGQPMPHAQVEQRRKNRELFNKKRGELLDDLIRCLDFLVYAQLSTIYHLE